VKTLAHFSRVLGVLTCFVCGACACGAQVRRVIRRDVAADYARAARWANAQARARRLFTQHTHHARKKR
jgi:hypothetical protein